ncbi:hypothetical protein [Shewanella chilikensis]|uniref:hypothetical protein n=1 Tax=Shewanella chilikensis TaxID=558541 RepID=UPI001F350A3C|nr:hypothetical protein [Shewanella chilikensis]MCE9789311.1 hypothetical protein [Shewanella chilikensis]
MDKKLQQTYGSVSIDHKIAALGGWRAEMLGHIRELIKAALRWRIPTSCLMQVLRASSVEP